MKLDKWVTLLLFHAFLSTFTHRWVWNHHLDTTKHRGIERMAVLLRELKKILGKVAGDGHCSHSSQDNGSCWYDWAIAVTAPGTVDDADMTELYEFRILYFYGEGDYVLKEDAAEGEVMS